MGEPQELIESWHPTASVWFFSQMLVVGECWLYPITESYRGGYAGGGGAHRRAYAIWYGRVPAGLRVLHTCDEPRCCRPDHLWLGTQADNMRDMARKGRGRKPAWYYRHKADQRAKEPPDG